MFIDLGGVGKGYALDQAATILVEDWSLHHVLLNAGALDHGNLRLRSLFLPDCYLDQGSSAGQLQEAGLDADGIVSAVMNTMDDSTLMPITN